MIRLVKAAFLLFIVQIYSLSGMAIANTLSDTYFQVFVAPHQFDGYLNNNIVIDPNYFTRFDNCFQLTIPILNQMENQLQNQYSTCPNTTVCKQIGNDIQSITGLMFNVRNLENFIRAAGSNPQLRFINSRIGSDALTVYNLHINIGIPVNQSPEFVKQISILSGVPCQ